MKIKKYALITVILCGLAMVLHYSEQFSIYWEDYVNEQEFLETQKAKLNIVGAKEKTYKKPYDADRKVIEKVLRQSSSKKLTKIDMSNRNLDRFPFEFGTLENLVGLDLDGNPIKGSVGLLGFPKLDSLSLTKRSVQSLFIGEHTCQRLRVLDFSSNQIERFTVVDKLEKLEVLNLAYNDLKEFPNVAKMPNLKHLNIRSNNLTELPYALLRLEHLEWISVGKNDFKLANSQDVLKRLMDKEVRVIP